MNPGKTRPLRLGLLGTGVAARRLYLPALKRLGREVVLVACANRTRAKAETFARDSGSPKVVPDLAALAGLPDVEAVLVSLPIPEQPRAVLECLRLGKAVLSEKPVAPDLGSGRALLAKVRGRFPTGPLWMVAENYRFMPHVDWALERLRAGDLGEVRVVEVRQSGVMDPSNPYFHTAWRRDARFVGGFVFDAGVHLAHVARRLLGTPTQIRGLTAGFHPELKPMDTAVAALRFPGGAVGLWLSSFSCDCGGAMLTLRGSRASLEIHREHALLTPAKGRARVFRSQADSYALQLLAFARALRAGEPSPYPPSEALEDLAFMEGVVRGRVLRSGPTSP